MATMIANGGLALRLVREGVPLKLTARGYSFTDLRICRNGVLLIPRYGNRGFRRIGKLKRSDALIGNYRFVDRLTALGFDAVDGSMATVLRPTKRRRY